MGTECSSMAHELKQLKSYEKLIWMGFDDTLSFQASQKFNGNIDKAVEYIVKKMKIQNSINREDIDRNCSHDDNGKEDILSPKDTVSKYPPYRIENRTLATRFRFCQQQINLWRIVEPLKSVAYGWDDPQREGKKIIINIIGQSETFRYNIDSSNDSKIKYKDPNNNNIFELNVGIQMFGPTKVLIISDFKIPKQKDSSILKLKNPVNLSKTFKDDKLIVQKRLLKYSDSQIDTLENNKKHLNSQLQKNNNKQRLIIQVVEARNLVQAEPHIESYAVKEEILSPKVDNSIKQTQSIDTYINKCTKIDNSIKQKCIFRNKHKNEQCNSIDTCSCIMRIKVLLQIYNNYMNEQSFMKLVNDRLDENYTINDILNDYIHILYTHDDNNNFERLYDFLNIKCNLAKCVGMQRNQRNRINRHPPHNIHNIYNNNCTDKVITDIMDQIHCYLVHTLDVGHRLTNNDDEKRNYSLNKIAEIVMHKRKTFENIIEGQDRIINSKFVTKIDHHTNDIQENDTKQEQNSVSAVPMYHFSHRFDYWSSRRSFAGIKVRNLHHDLKSEMLNNSICSIGIDEWEKVENKARRLLETAHAKSMNSRIVSEQDSDWFYDGSQLFVCHLISLIFYTDYDDLSTKFSSTFRPNDTHTNFPDDLRDQHSNFYWMARYLRELVAGYGDILTDKSTTKAYYHGISQSMIFKSTIAKFHHPLSTTKQISVAMRFATTAGIILNLQRYWKFEIAFFDCKWVSKYTSEDESLFIGGSHPLQITNIIDYSAQQLQEYKKYLKVMNILIKSLDFGTPLGICSEDEQLLSTLIYTPKDIPVYMVNLFNSYRVECKCIKLNYQIKEHSSFLASLFFTSFDIDELFVNLRFIESLFPYLEKIIMYRKKAIVLSHKYIEQISTEISKYQWKCLDKIEIRNVKLYNSKRSLETFIYPARDTVIKITKFQFKIRQECNSYGPTVCIYRDFFKRARSLGSCLNGNHL